MKIPHSRAHVQHIHVCAYTGVSLGGGYPGMSPSPLKFLKQLQLILVTIINSLLPSFFDNAESIKCSLRGHVFSGGMPPVFILRLTCLVLKCSPPILNMAKDCYIPPGPSPHKKSPAQKYLVGTKNQLLILCVCCPWRNTAYTKL